MAVTLVVGLGSFGMSVVEQLHEMGGEIAVLDKDRMKVERIRDRCAMSAVVDAENLDALEKLMPEGLQAVVIDCGGKENPFLNILVANYYHKKMIPRIYALAYSQQHAEILRLVGATEAIVPEPEAANRVARSLARPEFSFFLPLAEDFALAEIQAPPSLLRKTVAEAEIRKRHGVQLVALKRVYQGQLSYRLAEPQDPIEEETSLLILGSPKKVLKLLD